MVHRALVNDGRLSSQPIEVSVSEAIVYLSGRVQSYRRKLLAQRLAGSFRECRDVVNQLEVEPAEIVDDETAGWRIQAALGAHADIDERTILVDVQAGWVTLRGTSSSAWERMLAEDVTLAVVGVRGVKNLVVVDRETCEQDHELCRRIQDALDRAPFLEPETIEVSVDGGVIVLRGRVLHLAMKEFAHDVATRHSSHNVRNEIVVER